MKYIMQTQIAGEDNVSNSEKIALKSLCNAG